MKRETALCLVADYIGGWLHGDPARVLRTVADDCVVIESHGPTFTGRAEIARWLDEWFGRGGVVSRWAITSFVFEGEAAAVGWSFSCVDRGVRYDIDGVSLFRFRGERIARIEEYRRTEPARTGHD